MNVPRHPRLLRQLENLGLNCLEAEVYVALLTGGPATAYQLAQRIGRTSANVYTAVHALTAKGAAAVQAGERLLVSAVPASEFLAGYLRRQSELAADAEAGLAALTAPPPADQLYALANVNAVLERARAMLGRAKAVAVVDSFPALLAQLEPNLKQLGRRRVKLYLQTYAPTRVAATQKVQAANAEQILDLWNCEFLVMVTDSQETLFALCTHDLSGVYQAYWSNSVYLACVQHAGLLREQLFFQLRELLAADDVTLDRVRQLLSEHPTYYNEPAPGQERLKALVGPPRAARKD